MNHCTAKLFTFYILNKTKRKQIRNYLNNLDLKEIIKIPLYIIKIFFNLKKISNSYCLFELNPFHIECMYSIYSFCKLKHSSIVIFTTHENIKKNLFNGKKVNIFHITPFVVKILDFFKMFNKMNEIFVGSYYIWYPQKTVEYYFANYLKNDKIIKCIDHDPTIHLPTINRNVKTFVLSEFLSKKFDKPYLYTFIFPQTNKQANKINKKLISVGVIGDLNRRDTDTYLKILHNNPQIFSYFIASSICDTYKNKLHIPNIEVHQNASFSQLFKSCSDATFIPFLIHNEIIKSYSNRITGNINLVYGFNLIPIIDREFASLYNITEKEGILYSGKEELKNAILYSQTLSEYEILKKISAIKQKKKIYEDSIINNVF